MFDFTSGSGFPASSCATIMPGPIISSRPRMKRCPTCDLDFSSPNFARHRRLCIGGRSKGDYCQSCGTFFLNLKLHQQRPCTANLQSHITSLTHRKSAYQKSAYDILDGLATFTTKYNKDLMSWIGDRKWYYIYDALESVRASNILLPRLIPADECWYRPSNGDRRLPTFSEVWNACFGIIIGTPPNQPGSYQVYDVYEQPSPQIGTVMGQLRPQPEEMDQLQGNPMIAVNLQLNILDYEFRVPAALQREFQFNLASIHFGVNATPTYAFVDVHIDRGMDAISSCIGACRKIWFLWPPTQQNLTEMRRVDCQRNFRMLRSQLDNGIIVETDGTMALHIPAGWLHAIFTVEGGFLAGITAVTAESIRLISSWMEVELESDDLGGNLDTYIHALEEVLCSQNEDVVRSALEGWKQLQPRLMELMECNSGNRRIAAEQQRTFVKIWTEFCKRADQNDLVVRLALNSATTSKSITFRF